MTELDDVLRQSFARIAEPGDPAGVVDAIRSRMAAGDTGTPASSSGFLPSRDRILPWLFGGAVLLLGTLAVGMTLALATTGVPTAPEAIVTQQPVVSLDPNPTSPRSATPTVAPTSTPVETAEPAPTEPARPPAPAPDTAAPTLGGASGAPVEVFASDSWSAYCAVTTTISVVANDNVGVTGVLITWAGVESGTSQMTSGSSWTFVFNPAEATPTGNVTFTMIASDAAGNTSATAKTTVKVWDANSCVI